MTLLRTPDLAVDLGTARIRVAGGRTGICERPANPATGVSMERGVVVDASAASRILHPMFKERRRLGGAKMRVLACAPTDVSALERNLVRSCILEAGATSVIIVPEPLAAAVGSHVDIGSRYSKLIVDFGDGVTDCAVISDGRITASMAERTGCADLRRVIQRFAADVTGMVISDSEADRILRSLGTDWENPVMVQGISCGRCSSAPIPPADLYAELWPVMGLMLRPVKTLLENLDAGKGAEVIEDGIFLTGGGALIHGMREAVAVATGIETRVVKDPLGAVIRGACRMLPFASCLNLWKMWGTHQRTFPV
ncbi:MAG: actin-like protein ATPase involved in cell morphosis-like protein [Verrucomicrobiales bacterium]|nr:actin-like protein ATPase involved in cell morphosis-like protein [Verrucomicrobiales bacterium]